MPVVGQFGAEAMFSPGTSTVLPNTAFTVRNMDFTPAKLYSNLSGTAGGTGSPYNPVNTDADGNLLFYAAPGQYQLQVGGIVFCKVYVNNPGGTVIDVGPPSSGDDSATVNNAVAICPPGGTVLFRAGNYTFNPLVLTNPITLQGQGAWATQLAPNAAITGNFIQFNIAASGTWQAYGPRVNKLGLNLYGAPSCTGLRFESNAGWSVVDDVVITGGAIGISNAGTNNRVQHANILDTGVGIHIVAETGLELHLNDIQFGRNSAGTTTRWIECIATTYASNYGALYMTNVFASSGTSGGVQTNGGIYMSAPAPANASTPAASMPLFAVNVVMDDIIGGNPGVEFVNVADISYCNGWINTGAASGGAAVRITGGRNYRFIGNEMFGGIAGGTARTYEFAYQAGGGTYCPRGFVSKNNILATNWVYYFPVANISVTDMLCDDYIPGATNGFAVSNDMAQFKAACTSALRFGAHADSDQTLINQLVMPDGISSFFTTLVNGVSPAIPARYVSNTLSHIIPYYYLQSGVMGILRQSVITGGTSFVITSYTSSGAVNTADQSTIGILLINRG